MKNYKKYQEEINAGGDKKKLAKTLSSSVFNMFGVVKDILTPSASPKAGKASDQRKASDQSFMADARIVIFAFVQTILKGLWYCAAPFTIELMKLSKELLGLVGSLVWTLTKNGWNATKQADSSESASFLTNIMLTENDVSTSAKIRKRTSAIARLIEENRQHGLTQEEVPYGLKKGDVFRKGLMFGG